jgi:RND family efflux transporter MFP subunit
VRTGNVKGIVLGLTALALAGCGRSNKADPAGEPAAAPVAVETARVTVQPMETIVVAQGTLAPAQGDSAKVAAVTAGRIETIPVREGDRVAAGQVVATLDSRASNAQANQARYGAQAAESDRVSALRAARLALDAAGIDREAALQQARTTLQSAETDLAKTRAGARPQEIAQADQAVRQAQATRDRAASEIERVKYLNEKGIVPKRQLEDAQTALSVAESGLGSAKAQASLVRAGSRIEDVRAAELRVQAAREALAQARKSGDAHVRQAKAALRQAEQGTLLVEAKRQEAISMQAAAAYTVLRSPIPGIVTHRMANPGDTADPASPILEIANTTSLNLLANLPEGEGAGVRPGQIVRLNAGPQTAAGRVLTVGQVDPQTNLLSVRIAVANPGGRLKPGSFAMARIIVHSDPRGVAIPKEAVVSREGKSVAFTVSPDGTAHQRTVTLGPEQDAFVEVRSGLKPGETVIRVGQYELPDGAKVKPAGAQAQ